MKVRDIMTPRARLQWVYPNTPLVQAARVLREHNIGALPVLEGEKVAGIATDRDLVVRGLALDRDPFRTLVRDVMSKTLRAVRPEDDVAQLCEAMAKHQVRRMLVLEDERLVGIVTLADVARHDVAELAPTVKAISR
jgi:CBS domain-containing protein